MAKSMVWVTPTAKEMAYELIMELRIKQSRSLAIFLGCPISYDNYSAMGSASYDRNSDGQEETDRNRNSEPIFG